LGWSHFQLLIPLKDQLKREFYAEMCRLKRWSVRTLRDRIDGLLYERTAIARKPEEQARQDLAALREEDRLTPDLVFRDPYGLDFLGLHDMFSEADLEQAILREPESFLLELGGDFCAAGCVPVPGRSSSANRRGNLPGRSGRRAAGGSGRAAAW
jgi:predicted nuclease of restriction endonuclease-like (RecB) superfamily